MRIYLLSLLLLVFVCSCKNDTAKTSIDDELHIAIKKDPSKLHPLLYPVQTAREIYQYIFTPLADFDPVTYELKPILLSSIPEAETITEGPEAGYIRYVIDIRKDATWEDGTPITGQDYVFTLKAIKHPEAATGSYRSYMTDLVDARVSPDDPQQVEVLFDEYYFLSREIVSTLEIYPRHIYDPTGILDKVSIPTLADEGQYAEAVAADSMLTQFATAFNSVKYTRETVSGAGPYKLVDWVADQIVVLERKENYWAADSDDPYLQAGPKRLIFHIIPDELSIINQLKAGEIDLYPAASAGEFVKLRDSEQYRDKYRFLTPEILRTYFIALNNTDPALADVDVRKAVSHLVDVQEIIDLIEYGLAKRATSPININKPYYNKTLVPVEENIEKAKQILANDGWSDTNANGTIDKKIDGKVHELELDMYTTGSDLSNKIALLLSENAKAVGIQINITQKKYADFSRENLPTRDYDMITSAVTQDLAYDDLYQKWHSDNDTPTGGNTFSYRSNRADKLIDGIRDATDESERLQLYQQLQTVLDEDQPVIWLYHPLQKIILSKEWKGSATAKRPGYLANTFVKQ